MDLESLVNSFATGTYVVTRRASGGFSRGVALPTVNSTFSITASVTPASGQDLLRLPEGRRSNQTRILFTTTQLMVGDQDNVDESDIVTIDGGGWEIQRCEVWVQASDRDIVYRAIAQQLNPETT